MTSSSSAKVVSCYMCGFLFCGVCVKWNQVIFCFLPFFFFFFFFLTVKLCFLFRLFVVVFDGIYCGVCMILLAFCPFKCFFFAPFCARKNNTGSSDAFVKFLWYIFCQLHISCPDLSRVLLLPFFFSGGGIFSTSKFAILYQIISLASHCIVRHTHTNEI